MSWWSQLFGRKRSSASLAKQRLSSLIEHERKARTLAVPEYLPRLQRELQLVVAKYVQVQPKEVSVRIGHPRHAPDALEVRIELPQGA